MKYAVVAGLGMGGVFGVMFASYALGFWFGSHCVEKTDVCNTGQNYTAGNVLIVFFCILMAGFNFSQLTPALKKIAEGRQAAARIYQIIDRQPLIKNP
jgi:ATP-binding cassette subfamily B (MDR/TAP) protein 1